MARRAVTLWLLLQVVPCVKTIVVFIISIIGEEYVLNLTISKMERSQLNLVLAGTTDVVLMVEGGCEEWPGFAQLPLWV